MKKGSVNKIWENLRRKISTFLIIVLIITSADYTVLFANNQKRFTFDDTQYIYAPELLVEDSALDDDMFYIPHGALQVQEKDAKNKYVFKVMRKGKAEKAEKVKLTMLDITAKYGRDYTIKVIDELVNSENVQNAGVAKSVSEIISTSEFEEYNYSDAIIDGSIKIDDILSEDDNYKMSEEEKTEVLDNVANMLNEFGMSGELDVIDTPKDSSADSKDDKTEPTNDEDENKKEDDTNATEAEGDEGTTVAAGTSLEHEETTKNESKDKTEETTTTKKQEETTKEKVEEKEEATKQTTEKETKEETTEMVKEENNETVSGHTNTETEVTTK